MININSPLCIRNKLKPILITVDPIPILDILCIAFFITLISSKFIFAPGISIALPQSTKQSLQGTPCVAVLSVNQANMLFFEGNIYNLDNIEAALSDYSKHNLPTLLAKINKDTNVDTFFKICEIAHKAGFTNIQLAANFNQFDIPSKPY